MGAMRDPKDRVIKQLLDMLKESKEFHEYCGWGDAWERSCAKESRLWNRIDEAIEAGEAELKRVS